MSIQELTSVLRSNHFLPVPDDKTNYLNVKSPHYLSVGCDYLELLVEHAQLKPNHSVLDIGCGPGRMAVPMTQYIQPDGRYTGVDVVTEGIEWCKKNISSKYSNFEFKSLDVNNSYYNPKTKKQVKSGAIPCPDKSQDVIYAVSVFTHLTQEDAEVYMAEVKRLLKPTGKALLTFYVLDKYALNFVQNHNQEPATAFAHDAYPLRHVDPKDPEYVVAHYADYLESLFAKNGLRPVELNYGNWARPGSGRKQHQDFFVLELDPFA